MTDTPFPKDREEKCPDCGAPMRRYVSRRYLVYACTQCKFEYEKDVS